MTKAKKKMTKSTFVIIIMAVAMVAMLAFGGTFAYFTATATTESSNFTTGSVKLSADATYTATATEVVPGDIIVTGASVTPTTVGTDSYLAVKVVVESNKGTVEDLLTVTFATTDGVWIESTSVENVYVYCATGGSSATDPTPKSVVTGTKVDVIKSVIFNADDNWVEDSPNSESQLMGAKLTFTMESRSVQSDNYNDGSDAVASGGTAATVNGIATLLFGEGA